MNLIPTLKQILNIIWILDGLLIIVLYCFKILGMPIGLFKFVSRWSLGIFNVQIQSERVNFLSYIKIKHVKYLIFISGVMVHSVCH